MTPLYPLTFTPALKDFIWGGRNLERLFGRALPPGVVAESWEVAAHPDGNSMVQNGPYAGLSLPALHRRLGRALTGRRAEWAEQCGKFPLLVKLLDAHQPLSVQVHPNDDYAQEHEGEELGKTEMWVVLHAEPEAAVILGVKAGTQPETFRPAAENGRLEPYLHRIPVSAGDVVCVPAGSLHAILAGLVIAEIQQNSNTTYRVYDWNRLGNDGKGRPLHLDKAMDVINFNQVDPSLPQPTLLNESAGMRREELCRNNYFVVERLHLTAGASYSGRCDGETLEIWGTIDGRATMQGGNMAVALPAVQFALLPAEMGEYSVMAETTSVLLRAYCQ
jgi:mannose-6-phosphate isomerase